MQIIPANWAIRLEELNAEILKLGIDALDDNTNLVACRNLVGYVHEIFGSSQNFDAFLKADILNALKVKGYDAKIPGSWDDGYMDREFQDPTLESEAIWLTYKHIYKLHMDAIPFLPQRPTVRPNTLDFCPA